MRDDGDGRDAFDSRYTEYQVNRSAFRKLVRRVYLRSASTKLQGAVLDFGCGIGELLSSLPAGSKGLEYNKATAAYCRDMGLDVDWYDGYADDWSLSVIPDGRKFDSMIISHVLEHLDEPMEILRKMMHSASRLGARRILVIVPSRLGFKADSTHRTFIDEHMLTSPDIVGGTGYGVASAAYFPLNLRVIGDLFAYHELQVSYDAI